MLEKFINEVSKPIVDDKGKELNKELINLFERNPSRKDLEVLSTTYGIRYTVIESDFLKAFENEDEDDFKRMLQEKAHAYDRYYKQREDKIVDPRFLDFKKTFEILYKHLATIEKIIYATNRKIDNILLTNPWIEYRREMFKKILEGNTYMSLSEETKEKKKAEFITKLKGVKDDIDGKEYRAIFREIFEIPAKKLSKEHYKLFYETLGLPDEFSPYIDKIDEEVIKILISINQESKEEDKKARMSHLINNILRGKKEIPEKAFNNFTVKWVGQGIKVLGKIDLENIQWPKKKPVVTPEEVRQATTTDPLSLVGKIMKRSEFLSAFNIAKEKNWILSEEVLERRKEEIIPAQYFRSSTNGKLHFFLVGQENRGYDQPYINVCIKDNDIPREIKIEEGKVYEISILEFKESEEAQNNTRKQSYNINGEFISDTHEEE